MLERIYYTIDQKKEGCLKAKTLVSDMLFFIRGRFEHKMLLFFEANAVHSKTAFILPKATLTGFFEGLIIFYQGLYNSAKEILSKDFSIPKFTSQVI